MSGETKAPADMNRLELLAYVQQLQSACKFMRGEVAKAEGNAVLTIAALVQAAGGKLIVKKQHAAEAVSMQISRAVDEEGNFIFEVRVKPTDPETFNNENIHG